MKKYNTIPTCRDASTRDSAGDKTTNKAEASLSEGDLALAREPSEEDIAREFTKYDPNGTGYISIKAIEGVQAASYDGKGRGKPCHSEYLKPCKASTGMTWIVHRMTMIVYCGMVVVVVIPQALGSSCVISRIKGYGISTKCIFISDCP